MWTFYVIAFIVATFMAVVIARAIYEPIKKKRSKKAFDAWKKQSYLSHSA